MKLAEENKNKRITFAAISCTAYRSLCSINHVRGYPSILAFNIPATAPGRPVQCNIFKMSTLSMYSTQYI